MKKLFVQIAVSSNNKTLTRHPAYVIDLKASPRSRWARRLPRDGNTLLARFMLGATII
jgi:hypothetical protein